MEQAYKTIAKSYKNAIEILLKENTAIVDLNLAKKELFIDFKCLRDKAIIPFIETSPKSNFLTITPINLYTKDDPILRYVPSIRNNQHSSIIWFEGTVFGTKAFDEINMVDIMFLKYCSSRNKAKEGLEYIKNTFGRDLLDPNGSFSLPDNQFNKNQSCSMDDLFCTVCFIFDCGIHRKTHSKILNFNEDGQCLCKTKSKHLFTSADKNFYDQEFVNMKKYPLNPCIASLVVDMKYNKKISCCSFPKPELEMKKIVLSKRIVDAKQFYHPCEHTGKCLKHLCECIKQYTYCESACSCTNCTNAFFCACNKCDNECPCLVNGRECTDFCKCETNPGKSCNNRPIQQRIFKKTSICKSLKHGLGLFCEEFISANGFAFEYTGELISDKEAERRGNFYEMNKLSYLFNCVFSGQNCLYSIDAFFLGNKSRFINHSVHKANLKSEILVSKGNVKIVFYSTRDIYKGEEFFFDYQFTEAHKLKHGIVD